MVKKLKKNVKGTTETADSKGWKPSGFAKFAVLVGAVTTMGLINASCDNKAPGTCESNLAPTECHLTGPLAQGVVAEDTPLQMGNLVLRLEGVEEHGDGLRAVLAVDDNCGNTVKRETVSEGETKALAIEGAEYEVTVNALHKPLNGAGTEWVDVTVNLNCLIPEPEPGCVPDLTPTDCHSTEPVAQGITTADEPLQMGNLKLYLESTEEHGGVMEGIFRIEDNCGNVLKMDKVSEGQTKTFSIEGAQYDVTVNSLHATETGTEWADVTVELNCPPSEMCLLSSGVLNIGEELLLENLVLYGDLKVRLDDVNSDHTAFLSILDSQDNVLEVLSVAQGQSVSALGRYMISVPEVAAGYTFGAKWARIELYSTNCE